ncbi:MAG TPA: prepilin-type N-terminal cleavage/methylation domain-containing protein [Opitutaceae bacterium]|nr:prepilin-type N-terminal cleavage/methylation domain-containing protein [Opitutaceae bacterium]
MLPRNHLRCVCNRAGFTLIEVMMATAIVVVGLAGLMQVAALGIEALDTDRKQQVASELVAAEIARLRAGPWSAIADLPASATLTFADNGSLAGDTTRFAVANYTATAADDDSALAARAAGFTCTLTATRLRPVAATASNVTFVKVVYTVSWRSSAGRSHRRVREAYLGMNGLHLSYQQT